MLKTNFTPGTHLETALIVVALALGGASIGCASGERDEGSTSVADTTADESEGESSGGESESTESESESTEDDTSEADTTVTDGECSSEGCACGGAEDICDEGLSCIDGLCAALSCNHDGTVDPGEQCDDGNDDVGDGCDNDCSYTLILDIAAGGAHTCALIENGRVRCWGLNSSGQLGYNNTENIGDNEDPSFPGDVPLNAKATALSVGGTHACALLEDGTLRCWGENASGQLGYGNNEDIGDDEFPFSVNAIDIAAGILEVTTGRGHTCVRVGEGGVRCWGGNAFGQLGYSNANPLAIPLVVDVALDAMVTMLSSNGDHNCALLEGGGLRCWGRNDKGQLGYGHTENIGDDEDPDAVGTVPLMPQGVPDGTPVIDLALGEGHSCVLYEGGDVLCWGDNFYGQIGQGTTTTIGDNETLATLFPISLGGDATGLALGKHHSCATLEGGELKCWGRNLYGQLGNGNIEHIGDDELPSSIDPVVLGGTVTALTAGDYHTCVVIDSHDIFCWGFNDYGQLGYGDTQLRGDDELPPDAGPVPLLVPQP